MTPSDLRQIADSVGGPRALAKILSASKDWVYRRISGETPIEYRDELAVRKAVEELTP